MVMTVAAMFHQLVNIDIAREDSDTLPPNKTQTRCLRTGSLGRPGAGLIQVRLTQGLRSHSGPSSLHDPILSSMEVASLL